MRYSLKLVSMRHTPSCRRKPAFPFPSHLPYCYTFLFTHTPFGVRRFSCSLHACDRGAMPPFCQGMASGSLVFGRVVARAVSVWRWGVPVRVFPPVRRLLLAARRVASLCPACVSTHQSSHLAARLSSSRALSGAPLPLPACRARALPRLRLVSRVSLSSAPSLFSPPPPPLPPSPPSSLPPSCRRPLLPLSCYFFLHFHLRFSDNNPGFRPAPE